MSSCTSELNNLNLTLGKISLFPLLLGLVEMIDTFTVSLCSA